MDQAFTFSTNDPYTIKTNLKDENRNILQIAKRRYLPSALLDNISKQAKKVLMLGLLFILKDKHPQSTQKPLWKSGLFVTKNYKKSAMLSLYSYCEAHMNAFNFVPQVLSPTIVKLLSISTGKRRTFSTLRDRSLTITLTKLVAISSENPQQVGGRSFLHQETTKVWFQ
jgi:hypothetical protein